MIIIKAQHFYFNGNEENNFSIDNAFKFIYTNLTAKNSELELNKNNFVIHAKINFRYNENEFELEENLNFRVELFTNGDHSSVAIIVKEDDTNKFTFQKFLDNMRNELVNKEDEN